MRSRCSTFAAAGLTLMFGAAMGRAQEPPREVLLDAVTATVGDAAILWTKVETVASGPIRTRAQLLGRPLTADERRLPMLQARETLINQHCLAQAAKTIGALPPDRIEAIIQAELRDFEADQIRTFGTYQKFSENLLNAGQTWDSIAREQRLDQMAALAEQLVVHTRLNQRTNLFITPRMMREFYDEHRELFVYGPSASVMVVVFTGPDAAANAAAGAAIWREEERSAAELAQSWPTAVAQPNYEGLTDDSKKSVRAAFVDFALHNPAGTVSDPMPLEGGSCALLKVLEQRPGSNGRYDDPEVQENLRRRLEQQVVDGLREQARRRSRNRAYVWYLEQERR